MPDMIKMRLYLNRILILLVVALIAWTLIQYYSYVFSKKVSGEVLEVAYPMNQMAIIGNNVMPSQMFSVSVSIKDPETGQIHVASSEDRQWAVVKAGHCVTARLYPYPPWNLDKGGSYYNARLLEMRECAKKQ